MTATRGVRPDRRTGQNGHAQQAADQRGDREEISEQRWSGEEAHGRHQLYVATTDHAGREGRSAKREECEPAGQCPAQDRRREATRQQARKSPEAEQGSDRQGEPVVDAHGAQIPPGRDEQQRREGDQAAGLKRCEQRHPTPFFTRDTARHRKGVVI